jgi:hypothetical protein
MAVLEEVAAEGDAGVVVEVADIQEEMEDW